MGRREKKFWGFISASAETEKHGVRVDKRKGEKNKKLVHKKITLSRPSGSRRWLKKITDKITGREKIEKEG